MMNYTQEKPNAQKKPRTQKRLQMLNIKKKLKETSPGNKKGQK
jgi:hypothetical protein